MEGISNLSDRDKVSYLSGWKRVSYLIRGKMVSNLSSRKEVSYLNGRNRVSNLSWRQRYPIWREGDGLLSDGRERVSNMSGRERVSNLSGRKRVSKGRYRHKSNVQNDFNVLTNIYVSLYLCRFIENKLKMKYINKLIIDDFTKYKSSIK